ncbi:MAG: hypothetical protein R3E10_00850 [Gemmatimonadota bacterium]
MQGQEGTGSLAEFADEELLFALQRLAREEASLPLGMISRLEAGVVRAQRASATLSADAAAVMASLVFVVGSLVYDDVFSVAFSAALAAASGLYAYSLRWILAPVNQTT